MTGIHKDWQMYRAQVYRGMDLPAIQDAHLYQAFISGALCATSELIKIAVDQDENPAQQLRDMTAYFKHIETLCKERVVSLGKMN